MKFKKQTSFEEKVTLTGINLPSILQLHKLIQNVLLLPTNRGQAGLVLNLIDIPKAETKMYKSAIEVIKENGVDFSKSEEEEEGYTSPSRL